VTIKQLTKLLPFTGSDQMLDVLSHGRPPVSFNYLLLCGVDDKRGVHRRHRIQHFILSNYALPFSFAASVH